VKRHGISGILLRELEGRLDLTVIDVGASEGDFTAGLARTVGVRRALLIEPQPKRCSQMTARFADDRFKVINAAVGDREDRIRMDVLNSDYSSSILPVRRDRPEFFGAVDVNVRETIDVRLAPLDALCSENAFPGPYDILKIDVQGAEHLAIAGAKETLERTGMLWVEVSYQTQYDEAVTIDSIIRLLRGHGFILSATEPIYYGSDGELLSSDALFVRRPQCTPEITTNG